MTNRRKRMKRILKSRFYRIYFALVALALVGIAVGVVWLLGMLRDYEAAQPVYVAREVAALFESADYDRLYGLDTAAEALSNGDRAFYTQSLTELTRGGSIEWTEAFSPSEDERRYAVTLDGGRFATFTLVPSGQTDRRGNRLWTLGSVTTNVTLREPEPEQEPGDEAEPTPEPTPAPTEAVWQCHVTVPEGYSVFVDGVALTEENATLTRKNMFEEGFLPEGVNNPTLVDYAFDSRTTDPAIAAADANGAAVAVNHLADKALAWECPYPEDGESREKYGSAAIKLGKQVARFMSRDAGKGAIQSICAKGSPAATIFKNLSNQFTTPHTGVSVRDEAASGFYKLSDDCFTCHVTFNYVLYTTKGEKVYPTAYTFCVIRQNGSGRLYNMLSF